MPISNLIITFWISHPALLYGISLQLGFYAGFYDAFEWLIPCLGVWLPFFCHSYKERRILPKFFLSLALFLAAWAHAIVFYTWPALPEEGIPGTAHISIQSLSLQTSPFGSKWIYHCQLQRFFPTSAPKESIADQIPCSLMLPNKMTINRPLANQDYLVQGRLVEDEKGRYRLKINPYNAWSSLSNTWSYAEDRFQWKLSLSKWIRAQFKDSLNGLFLAGLATGDLDSSWIREEFARFGLQHILAISGFHFSIIASCLSFFLRLLVPRKAGATLLLIILAAYTFFLGAGASILRAWIMSSIVVIGFLCERQAKALNTLGIALMGVLAIDPLLSQTIGFQFSFLVTAAILLAYSPMNQLLSRILPKRSLSEVIEMNGWNQHGYIILALFRDALALACAVNLAALPLTLYFFHQFPWMSLFYNLFFPFLVSGSLGLLLLGGLLSPIPYLSTAIHSINNFYTSFVLQLTYRMPEHFDHYLKIESFPDSLIVFYITILMLALIALQSYLAEKDEAIGQSWSFI